MIPIVALVGRPNVGKSTLFNRITKSKDAIVDDFPGVTRDRHYGQAEWDSIPFTLVDTGGFADDESDGFSAQIRFQVRQAIDDADVIVLVLDGKGGLSPYDDELIDLLRSVPQPVFYVANKIDGLEQEELLPDFFALGIDTIFPVSAEHGYGVPDFLDRLVDAFAPEAAEPVDDLINIAVVGRPNVGKSSLINRLLGEERLLVSDVPGTTRDAIDSICTVGDRTYRLIDTAGIRRKGKVSKKIEKFSVIKALKSLERCDVAMIVLDASEGITEQDVRIAGYAHERGCGCMFLLNKWDIVDKDTRTGKRFFEQLRLSAKFLNFAPVLTISAKTGQRVTKIFKLVEEIYAQYNYRISTGQLNKIVEQALTRNEPSLHKGKRLKFYYAAQVGTRPPKFVFFVNYPEAVHFSYRRYLSNQIRETAALDRTPLKILFRQRTGRIEFGKKKKRPHAKRGKK